MAVILDVAALLTPYVPSGAGNVDEGIRTVAKLTDDGGGVKSFKEIATSVDDMVKGAGSNAAKAANWKKPDGSTWWPDNDGFVGTPSKATLQPGTKFDRYGNPSGRFAAPEGTPYGQRSLASGSQNSPYNSYEVVKPFEVNSGTTAPWFDQPGGGTQYQLPMSINDLIRQGYIR